MDKDEAEGGGGGGILLLMVLRAVLLSGGGAAVRHVARIFWEWCRTIVACGNNLTCNINSLRKVTYSAEHARADRGTQRGDRHGFVSLAASEDRSSAY